MARIMVVEDDVLINELIVKNLELVGHTCLHAFDGALALEQLHCHPVDLLILDVMLPGMSGFDLIKKVESTPVIFLTARKDLDDRLHGLSLGADDYIVKPFAMPELLERVKAVLRRTKRDENFFRIGTLAIDFERQQVFRDGKQIELTAKEFAVLDLLVTNRNITLSREKIIDSVWGYAFDGDTLRVVDVYIQQLRQKLQLKEQIRSVYGMGYRLEI